MPYKPQDSYFKKAKQEGYRSRAAYKLLELQQRYRIMKPGDCVVDLGAAPGGWLQVAAKVVGPSGKVVGVDLQPIQPLPERNVILLNGDITSAEIQGRIKQLIGGPAHCLLSDLAPKLSGIRDADMARCLELNRTALAVAVELLGPNGSLVVKSFVGNDLKIFSAELAQYFATVQRTKPEATRPGSSEFYFCANGFKARPHGRPMVGNRHV
ncbi:MAG TPA: RlmE family RNA methyltransferase [Candidatus Binatus sp.]|nr:RlmE family RNA methyltransferase [Candidatus Binatus sp.]